MQPCHHNVDDNVLAEFAAALSLTPCNNPADDDDKYAKAATKGHSNFKVCDPIEQGSKRGVFSFDFIASLHVFDSIQVPWHLFIYTCFVFGTWFAFSLIGTVWDANISERFAALQLEILGLVLLREKIKNRKSVSGISGMTFAMYATTYLCRIAVALPPPWMPGVFDKNFALKDLDLDLTLGLCSLLLVLDILKSVFCTHRNTYDAELDVLKAWYIIPVCWILALLIRPQFEAWSFEYAIAWSGTMYMDVLALMPQVVMMAKSGGRVETPIANFVAVTTTARCGDLINSMLFLFEVSGSGNPFSRQDLISFWTSVAIQFVHLILVADFMYYFCKARAALKKDRSTPSGFCCCGCCGQSDLLDIIDQEGEMDLLDEV